ncbi:MAG: HDOD domain-containing protein [Marinobacter sp.]|uniref:HDOD domain-containing protein n=1 Tax=Marinobacter sp. TaxID=50741 RepID=UPI0034A06FD6
MALAARLDEYLNREGVGCQTLELNPLPTFDAAVLACGQPQSQVLKATLLIDLEGVLMAVHTYDSTLDIGALNGFLERRLQPLTGKQTERLFGDCEPGFHPPIGAAYDVPVIVDETVFELASAAMACGTDHSLVVMDARALRSAFLGARKGRIVILGADDANGRDKITLDEVALQLQKLYRLPPMPALALRILRLTSNNEATARELAELIEFDPSLTAQILRYARSALFNYPGQIDSVQEAVARVLGFDRVAHIAIGIASVQAFDVPRKGMLGMDEFWRHSLYCAFLCQQMAPRVHGDKSLAYLCGLLHNFGLLLVGHLFPLEFEQLNTLREANPDHSMQSLEHQVFGSGNGQELLAIGHGAIGGILHKLWQLPDAVIKSAGVHQRPDYHGEHEQYVLMVQLANGLLKESGIGDEFNPDDLDRLCQRLGLTENDLKSIRAAVTAVAPDLDALARSLTN